MNLRSPAAAERAIGLLVPASNRVLEPDFMRWLPAGVTLHTNRLHAPRVRPVDMLENLASLTTGVDEAARLLGLARPTVVAFGCTSGSFLRGIDWDDALCETLAAQTQTPHVTTTAKAVIAAFEALGARRLAVVTPYPETVNQFVRQFLQASGVQITSFTAMDGWADGIDRLHPNDIGDWVAGVPCRGADAVFVSCTNLRASEHIGSLEARLGLPVVTSNQATFWACARGLGLDGPLPGLGALGGLPHRAWPARPVQAP